MAIVGCAASPTDLDTGPGSSGSDGEPTEGDRVAFFTPGEVSTILSWLGPLPDAPAPDPTNAYADDPAAARLGQALFYDPRYSGDGQISCVTCHQPDDGFGDSRANVSLGISWTSRASIGLFNGAYGGASEADTNWQLWDGRADSQWAQALGPPESAVVMGGTRTGVALLLYDEYRDDYEAVFGAMPQLRDDMGAPIVDPSLKPGVDGWDAVDASLRDEITGVYVNFGKAIAAYERLLVSRNSRFDAFWADLDEGKLDSDALDEDEKEGLRVFIGEGRCLGCHSGPNFTDGQFHNIAVAQEGENISPDDPGRASGVGTVMASVFNCAGRWSDHPDKASCSVSQLRPERAELGAFKTPSLRSVSQTAPYMHTGNLETLRDVVLHYDIGGAPNDTFDGTRDELMRPLSLGALQRAALVSFLEALDGEPLDPALVGPPL